MFFYSQFGKTALTLLILWLELSNNLHSKEDNLLYVLSGDMNSVGSKTIELQALVSQISNFFVFFFVGFCPKRGSYFTNWTKQGVNKIKILVTTSSGVSRHPSTCFYFKQLCTNGSKPLTIRYSLKFSPFPDILQASKG